MTTYDCAATFERLQDYLDRELSLKEVQAVEAHLAMCGVCADEYKFESSVLHHIRDVATAPVPSELIGRIHSALLSAGD